MFKKNDRFLIKTPTGYEKFQGIQKKYVNSLYTIIFQDDTFIKCSGRHKLLTEVGFICSENITLSNSVTGKSIKNIEAEFGLFEVYDPVGVNEHSSYFSNGVISHNTEFLGSTNTLINGNKLQTLVAGVTQRSRVLSDIEIYEEPIKEEWDDEGKLVNIEHKYVICVDTSEGKKLDSSAFTVVDITETPYKLVAKYKSNIIAPLLYPSIIWQAAKHYNDAFVLIEAMTVGMQVADILHADLEYEHIIRTFSGNKKSQQVSEGYKQGSIMGLKMTAPVKRIGCQNLKTLIETDQFIIRDHDTVNELTTFVLNNKGSYEADDGAHDDLVMCLVIFAWLTTQKYFKELVTHDLRKQLRQQFLDFNDEEMLPAPVITDGREERFLDGFDKDLWTIKMDGNQYDPYEGYFKAI